MAVPQEELHLVPEREGPSMPLHLFAPDFGPFAGQEVYRRHLVTGERAVDEGIATISHSKKAPLERLLDVHTANYVDALRTGLPLDLASTGGNWSPETLDVSLSAVGAFLDAIDASLVDGAAGMLGGGGHHAFPHHGGALSPVNDMAIGAHYLRKRGLRRVLILDLDAHFGNGTTAAFEDDPDLFLFDFHGHASDFQHPDTPHLFKNFHEELDGTLYLRTLQKELPRVLEEFQPEACLYAAGMDVFSGTPNPPLRLRFSEIERREKFVFNTLSGHGVPVAYVHAGGYCSIDTMAGLHLLTARAANGVITSPDS